MTTWNNTAPLWHAILVGIRYILLWLPGLELANLIPDCSTAVGKILGFFCVCFLPYPTHRISGPDAWKIPLGRCPDVPCHMQELWWLDGSPILPRRW